jgi:phospho-N-acetylmuramoyl-pentapeptide-transferase
MFYYLLYPLHDIFSALNIFRYITFRASLASITAFLFCLIFGPKIIKKLSDLQIGQHIRTNESKKLYELHSKKQGTPTMGGIIILAAVILSTLLWSDIFNNYIWVVLLSTIWLGATGFVDDYLKHIGKCSRGLSARGKLISQIMLAVILGSYLIFINQGFTNLDIPFMKSASIDLGVFYVFVVILVIAGSSNAVNLTDGLDGLAIGSVIMVALAFCVLSYVTGHSRFSHYLLIPYVQGASELTIFCSSIVGAGLGFLWFNCHPATVFMGDIGSLALGGALGTTAILIKKEFLLVIVGGIFVVEALSVILQVASFKLTGKRIFKIAPLHHHFQFLGVSENKIIVRFWIIAALLALVTLFTLKIR